jgi:hypothetical protein
MDELFFIHDVDHDYVSIRDGSDTPVEPDVIKHSNVQFRISASAIEQMLKVAKAYEAMLANTSELEVTWGYPVEGPEGIVHLRGLPQYRFTSAPFFTNVDTIEVNGKPMAFDGDWSFVVIWDYGRGITFICSGEDGYELTYGGSVHDFELFLEENADRLPSP